VAAGFAWAAATPAPESIDLEPRLATGTPVTQFSVRSSVREGKRPQDRAPDIATAEAKILMRPVQMSGPPIERLPAAELGEVVGRLERSNEALARQNKNMRKELESLEGDELWIVVDSQNNELAVRRGRRTLFRASVSTGTGNEAEIVGGRKLFFETPRGMRRVIRKERDPVWYKPDWAYLEEGVAPPAEDDRARVVRGKLGLFALDLGDGFKIHGTPDDATIGRWTTHGCVRLATDDLATVYRYAEEGTRVYVF